MLNQYGKSGLKGLSKKLLVAAGVVTALGAMSGRANAATFPPFTFNPAALGYAAAPQVGDDINGPYAELLTITGANTFSVVAYAQLYVINNAVNTAIPASTSGDNTAGGYFLYSTFQSSGTFTTNVISGNTFVTFTGLTGSASVLNNVGNGDTFNDATGTVTDSGAPDTVLATANLVPGLSQGLGFINGSNGVSTGSYTFFFNPVVLTPLGSSFFTAPVPFYPTANVTGQFQTFSVAPGSSSNLTGTADVTFVPVPEPATLTIFGIGLLGLGWEYRRRMATNA